MVTCQRYTILHDLARDDNFLDNSKVQEVMIIASVVEEAPLSSSEDVPQ